MAWWNSRRTPDTPGQRVQKAMPALPPGTRTTPAPDQQTLAAQRSAQNYQAAAVAQLAANGLRWAEPTVPFGPGIPMPSSPINPARDDGTGRPAPRQYEYSPSWNLPGAGQKLVPWRTLRQAGDLDIVRALIEAKKAELCGFEWDVTIGKRALSEAISDDPNTPRAVLEKQMRDRLAPDIAKASRFWEKPDPDRGYDWPTWLGLVLEEMLVLDALSVYPRQTGGGLHALWVLDGSTIKPLLDQYGRRPGPPNPAYQQILNGIVRGDYTADANADGVIEGGFTGDELIYRPQVVRTWTPYGYSAVERALPIIGTLAARDTWIRSEYTDGARPDVFMTPDKDSDIDSTQYDAWEGLVNNLLAGNAEQRRRVKLGIRGSKLDFPQQDAEKYKPDYDLYLLQRLAAHFDMPLTELGFINPKGLGSAGFHEGQDDVNNRRNVLPWTRRICQLATDLQVRYLGIDPALEFTILGLDDEDEAATDAVVDMQTRGGRLTLNEGRDKRGEDRYDMPEADEPFIVAGREIIFIRGELDRQAQAQQSMANLVDPSLNEDPNTVDPDAPQVAPAPGVAAPSSGAQKAVPAKNAAQAPPAKDVPAKAPAKKATKAAPAKAPAKAVAKSEARDVRGRQGRPSGR